MMLCCEILKPSLYSTHSMQRYALTSFKKQLWICSNKCAKEKLTWATIPSGMFG